MKRHSTSSPRKVLIGTTMCDFRGTVSERIERASKLIDEVAATATKQNPGKWLDLVILPEHAIQSGNKSDTESARDRALPLEGVVLDTLGQKARQYQTYLIVPMLLLEGKNHVSNACVLLDRAGMVAGIYRKYHPVLLPEYNGILEGGVRPGDDFPVFACDFGKLGILICWDMVYEDGWLALGRQGAEIVAVSSASPQTVRPAAYAFREGYYVATSTPRDNASIFNPLGLVAAQIKSGNVLVHEIDLAYAILPWSPTLQNGQAFTSRYGNRAGYVYSESEDAGIFWSNDPKTPLATMIGELKLWDWKEQMDNSEQTREAVLRSS